MIHTHNRTLYSCKSGQERLYYLIWNDYWEILLSEKSKMHGLKGSLHTLLISCKGKIVTVQG